MILALSTILAALLTTSEAKSFIDRTHRPGAAYELAGEVVATERYNVILADAAGQICLWTTHTQTELHPGDLITAACATTDLPSDRLSRLAHAERITVTGHRTPAPPVLLTPTALAGNTVHVRARLRGVLTGVSRDEIDPDWQILTIEDETTRVNVWGQWTSNDISHLRASIDATLEIAGTACPRNTTGLRHYNGPWMSAEENATPVLVAPPAADPFTPDQPPPHRQVRTGRVLAVWGGNAFFLQPDDDPPIEVHLASGVPLPSVGACLTAAGFIRHNTFFTSLVQACVRAEPPPAAPPAADAPPRTAADVLHNASGQRKIDPKANGRLLRLTGRVRDISGADTADARLEVAADGERIPVLLGSVPAPALGSVIEATGICRIASETDLGTGGTIRLTGVSVILRTADDLRILRAPPWWTPLRLLVALGLLACALVAIFIWNASLRVLANRRGREMMRANIGKAEADLRTQERTRLAVELHDTIAQNLTGASFEITTAGRALDTDAATARAHLDRAERTIKSCRDDLRNCIWDLRSDALDLADLGEAIRQTVLPHVGEARLLVRVAIPRRHLSDNTVHAILKIVRELALNAVRHGRATEIRVAGSTEPGLIRLAVTDNGSGFDASAAPGASEGHFGLQGIAERLRRLNGTFALDTAPGRGCRAVLTIRSNQP